MALLSTTAENAALAAIFVPSTTYYLSLHTATPGQTGASEATGGSYARQVIQFGTPSGGSTPSTDSQTFTNMPASSTGFPYFGVWTAATGGTYLGGGTLSGLTGSLPAGINIVAATGSIAATIS